MKKLMMVLIGCLAMATAWGKSFSIDLRQPVTRNGFRTMAQVKAVSAGAEDSGFLRRVNLDAGAADVGKVAVGDELAFTLFDDVTITLALKKQMLSPLGGDVFLAEAFGYEGIKNAVVLRTEDGLTVDIQDYLNKKVYKVISTAAGVSVQEMEAKGGRCGCDAREPSNQTGLASAKPQKVKRVAANKGAESDETCVDILVAYDKNATVWANANGGGVTNFAQMAVQKMNTVLVNNGLDWYFRFRLVGVISVAASSDDLDFTLDSVTDGIGDWAAIKRERDEVGADIVTVLIDTGTEEGTTGVGWEPETTDFASFSENAYNCCAIRSVAQSHTMTHEVGHNMGAGHSDVQKTQPGPQLYSYSAGYYFTAEGDKYHTVMAYDGEGPGGIEVPYFSSQIHFYKDVAVGDEYHDNRFTLQSTCMAVSQWREAKGVDIGGDDDVPPEPLEWLTSRDDVFAKARAEGKKVFLIRGSDTCLNTQSTKNYSCEAPSVKRYLLRDYICWYKGTEWDEANGYFDGFDVGSIMPSIAIIDVENDVTLAAEGGYHTVNDLRVMLGRVAKDVTFSPESGFRFRDSVEVTLSAVQGAAIYYTLDGSDPSTGTSICYDKPIKLTATTTIRAIPFANGVWGLPIDAEFLKSRTEKFCAYEWTADVVDGGCVIVSVTPEPTGAISIPSRIEGLDVIGFEEELFKGNENLTSVAIPDSILEIPDYAFESCTRLSAVSIGNGVERIGAYAFGWTGLETIRIPESVTNIGDGAFDLCWAPLADAYLPKHLESDSIQDYSFDTHIVDVEVTMHYYSGELKQVAVHFDANGGELENSNQKLEIADNKIILPSSLPVPLRTGHEFLGWFTATNGGTQVTMDTVVTEGMTLYAHWMKINYTYTYIDNGDGTVTLSGWDKDWKRIDNPIVPAPVGKFVVPDEIDGKRVVVIEDGFFSDCYGMTSLFIPSSVTNMSAYAFARLYALKEIIIAGDNPTYMDVEGVLYTKDGKTLVAYPCGRGGDAVVASGTEYIGEAAFYNNDDLVSVSFPAGLKGIGASAFLGCGGWYGFTAVTIPPSVESIGSGAFGDCGNLETVTFEGDESLISIDDMAFIGTPYEAAKPFSLIVDEYGSLVGFRGVVPENLVLADYLAGRTVTRIDSQALSGWRFDTTALKRVVIPESVTYISSHAFSLDNMLEDVTLPASLQRIEYETFYNCTALREIRIPAGVEYVSDYAFEGCTNLTVHAPSTLRDAFSVPESCTIEYYELSQCTVTFNANGGMFEGGPAEVWTIYEGRRLDRAGEYYDYYDLPTPTLDGYTFLGWFTAMSGGTQITASTVVTGNVTYYAQWKVSGSVVTFNANGGSVTEASRVVKKNAAIGTLPKPTRTGYAFNGWYTKTSGGTKIKTSTKVKKDVTYYAQWTANKYTIKFDKNGGTGSMKSLSATYGKSVTLTANAFKRTNYTFLGWATKKGATEVEYKNKAKVKNLSAKSGGTATLYAVWKQNTYTVKFSANGGEGGTVKQTVGCGVKTALMTNGFTRAGFRFAGWATKKGGSVVYKNKAKVKDLAKSGKSVTLYAVWYPADWAVGTFKGTGAIGNTNVKKRKAASVTLTVGSTGKISGKFVLANGKSYSFKADAFKEFKDGALWVETTISYGSKKCALGIAVSQTGEAGATVADLLVTYKDKKYGTAAVK